MIVSFANLKKRQMSSSTQLLSLFCKDPAKKTKNLSDYERRQYLTRQNFVVEKQKLLLNFTFRINIGKRWFTTVLPLLQKMARKIGGKCRLAKKVSKTFVHIAPLIMGFFLAEIGGGSFEILRPNLKILFCFKLP